MGRACFEIEGLKVELTLPEDEVKKLLVEAIKHIHLEISIPSGREITQEPPPGGVVLEELPFCACGCGHRVKTPGAKYLRGHNRKKHSKKRSDKPAWREKDILRAFYIDGMKPATIAKLYSITVEEVEKIVNSERGKLYARVNGDFNEEKLRETLKSEVKLMQDLTRDAEVTA
ncbi:hypothetical protein [Candidatus Pyrohabitans sp.]